MVGYLFSEESTFENGIETDDDFVDILDTDNLDSFLEDDEDKHDSWMDDLDKE